MKFFGPTASISLVMLRADALDQRAHRHHRRDTDDDAEDRETGAELVRAQLIDGEESALAEAFETHVYSALSATTGSSRAARAAG
jgi:hypothetical protein